jgi:hypothetical protein
MNILIVHLVKTEMVLSFYVKLVDRYCADTCHEEA